MRHTLKLVGLKASELRPLTSLRLFAYVALIAIACCSGCRRGKNIDLMMPGAHPDWSPSHVIPNVEQGGEREGAAVAERIQGPGFGIRVWN